MKTLLVATDFSPDADRALATAVTLAKSLGAGLELCHVESGGAYVLPPPLDIVSLPPDSDHIDHSQRGLAERAERLRAEGLSVETKLLTGAPGEELVNRAAELGADMIVLGSRGLGALAHVVLGSVTDRVVRHAACPVLVVPHHRAPAK